MRAREPFRYLPHYGSPRIIVVTEEVVEMDELHKKLHTIVSYGR
jgi:hypothetical protein